MVYTADKVSLQSGLQDWDGTIAGVPAAAGTYVYHAVITFYDGKAVPYHGYVVLLR